MTKQKPSVQPAGQHSRYRVLLVEDHAPLAEATAELIRHEGLDVRIAASGEDALKMAAAFWPEIVLCDVRLPDMSGLDVAKRLRRTLGGKALVAIHTAFAEDDLRTLESEANKTVNMFVSKPLTTEKLRLLNAAKLKLEHSRSRRESSPES